MLKHLLHHVLHRRAQGLARWIAPHLPQHGYAADIGAGTGHNTHALRQRTGLTFIDIDVVNMRVVPGQAVLFDGTTLPFADQSFTCACLIFVLPYVARPLPLLQEVYRITDGPVFVVQSTYSGPVGEQILGIYDYVWGPVAFQVARATGLITTPSHALQCRTFYTRPNLSALFRAAGFHVHLLDSWPWHVVPVYYDLFCLER